MEPDFNPELRTVILNAALMVESTTNDILVHLFSIENKDSTKNFGTKAGISFKSKIDLLYDIGYIDKTEWLDLELQMVYRNKFLHDIECSSFTNTFLRLEASQVNRLLTNIDSHEIGTDEGLAVKAHGNLVQKNLGTLAKVLEKKQKELTLKRDTLLGLIDNSQSWAEHHFGFVQKINKFDESFSKDDLVKQLQLLIGADLEDVRKIPTHDQIISEEVIRYFVK